jgi:hypothetical protein
MLMIIICTICTSTILFNVKCQQSLSADVFFKHITKPMNISKCGDVQIDNYFNQANHMPMNIEILIKK